MFRTIKVEFPALDRLVTYLEGAQQTEVDLANGLLQQALQTLQKARTKLATEVAKENQ